MKLYHISITKLPGVDANTRFCDVMETFMGEYEVEEISSFNEWSEKEYTALGSFTRKYFNHPSENIEALFVEDDEENNIIETFMFNDNNDLEHWKWEYEF